MYDSCPELSVGYGIQAQSRVRLISVVSIRWHRVHTCQFLVLASHTQRVHFGLRDNARRLCPRTELPEQYMFPFASHSQSVWRLQHVRRPLVLARFMQRVDDCFHGNAQKLFRLRAALAQYCSHCVSILSQHCDSKHVRSSHRPCIVATTAFAVLLRSAAKFWCVEEPFDAISRCFVPSVDKRKSVGLHRFFRAPMPRSLLCPGGRGVQQSRV